MIGDREAVLVIPFEGALTKASTENRVAIAIRGGISAREASETSAFPDQPTAFMDTTCAESRYALAGAQGDQDLDG